MEQKNPKIELEVKQVPTYTLPTQESRAMYLRMALTHYRYLSTPNYSEEKLLKRLLADLKKMFSQAQSLSEQHPNDYQLHRIRAFFDTHYKQLLSIEAQQLITQN